MKNSIFSKLIRAVLVTLVAVAVTCFILIQFVDLSFIPTWDRLYGNDSSFDEVSDSITFLNVGEGDSALVRSNGRFVLVDTGDGESIDIVRKLKKFGVTGIDALVLTHWHSDHIGGVKDVIDEFPVLNVVAPSLPDKSEEIYENALNVYDAVRDKNIDFSFVQQGMGINVGDFRLSVVYCNTENENENNRSAILMARCRESKFLFMADAEASLEEELLEYGIKVDCDVIKIGHHGSSTSTSQKLIEAATPEYAVISVGADNNYGHPSSPVLEKLYLEKIEVLRTDRMGDIRFFVNEEEISVEEAS
ncbi:MAG: MBL fold metallo-hydrolase [Acutalibacteraceae bacterium]|nr:MBL fold metallo-hydrolase [Acutalibacteraceae bacterium]